MSRAFDAAGLLATLPHRPVTFRNNLLEGYCPPVWRYPLLGPYNGFTGTQRVRTWELETWLLRRNLLRLAPKCDLCGNTNRLGGHSESYADIERTLTLCGGCHLALHQRFRQPTRWRNILDRLPLIPEWATALSSEPSNFAQWLEANGCPTDAFETLRQRFPSDETIILALKAGEKMASTASKARWHAPSSRSSCVWVWTRVHQTTIERPSDRRSPV